MTHATLNGEHICDLAAQFVAGSMTAPELADWQLALSNADSPHSVALTEFELALLEIAGPITPVEPPTVIRAGLLHAIAPPEGFAFRFADEASFQPTPIPGVSFRLLHHDPARNSVTCLLRLAPGSRLPAHGHRGAEECVVLEGSILVGHTPMRVGDYQRAEADSEHVEQWTDTGALVYLSGPEDLFMPG